MISHRTKENIVACLLLVVFSSVIWLCQDFGPRARMIPLPLAIFGIVLTLIQLIWQNFRSTEALQMEMITVSEPLINREQEAGAQPPPLRPSGWRTERGALMIVLLLMILVLSVGPYPSVFLFTAAYFMLSGYASWVRSLAYSASLTLSIYLLFGVALEIQPYYGQLAPWFNR